MTAPLKPRERARIRRHHARRELLHQEGRPAAGGGPRPAETITWTCPCGASFTGPSIPDDQVRAWRELHQAHVDQAATTT